MATRRFYRRRFLNRRGYHAGAYVLADLQILKDTSGERTVDADLTIADCSRVTSLDLSAYNVGDARNALHKARLLRAIVNDFTDAFEETLAEVYPKLK
ncbi:hypothetical protein [Microlunatus soli]|uniref:Uncharacterized protein n=1 Tax=Microlunatus soli TaxID=630515 RepID=A0A1H1YKI4_9ACTN|nr:hypothetical protein [Microlunatus soli]SDT21922.1 hypothetical protein SAMN04489812_4632 [Microlunatus soli]